MRRRGSEMPPSTLKPLEKENILKLNTKSTKSDVNLDDMFRDALAEYQDHDWYKFADSLNASNRDVGLQYLREQAMKNLTDFSFLSKYSGTLVPADIFSSLENNRDLHQFDARRGFDMFLLVAVVTVAIVSLPAYLCCKFSQCWLSDSRREPSPPSERQEPRSEPQAPPAPNLVYIISVEPGDETDRNVREVRVELMRVAEPPPPPPDRPHTPPPPYCDLRPPAPAAAHTPALTRSCSAEQEPPPYYWDDYVNKPT